MKLLFSGFLIATALGAGAFAQGRVVAAPERPSLANNNAPTTSQTMGAADPAVYSQSLTALILSLDPDANALVINLHGKRVQFLVEKDTRLRADKNTELAGKTDLSLADYKPGQTVKIIYRVEDYKPLEVRLKRPKP